MKITFVPCNEKHMIDDCKIMHNSKNKIIVQFHYMIE